MTESAVVRVECAADTRFIDAAQDALDRLWAGAPHVNDEDRMLFSLAVAEIAANVVQHGSAREEVIVNMVLAADEDAVMAEFTDTADPALILLDRVAMPDVEAESGRGLALALAALDELTHETASGNTWRLRRHLRG